MASQITGVSIARSTVYSGADQRKHQSSASLAFERGNHRWPVDSPPKGPVTRKMSPFKDAIMSQSQWRGALMFSLICAWIKYWVNNREAGDLRRHQAHYGVIVMSYYSDVRIRAKPSQIAGVSIVCSTVYSGADQSKHQSSPSLAFVRGIHRWTVDSPHKGQ